MMHLKGLVLEGLGDWRRSHTCGELDRSHAGTEATLMGWVHRLRDHGGVLFIDLRDRYGITQVVLRPETSGAELLRRGEQLGNEWVIAVRGGVALRPPESLNPELATGEVELEVRALKALSAAGPLPFQSPGDFRARMRALSTWMKARGIYPER